MNDVDLSFITDKWIGKNPIQTPSKIAFRNKVKKAIQYYESLSKDGKSKRFRHSSYSSSS
jgi:hypothetical protein